MQRVTDLETLSSKLCVSTKSFPSGYRGRAGRKIARAQEDRNGKKTRPSRHNRNGAHMTSQKLWEHAQGLHKSKRDGVPVRKEVDTMPHC